MRGLVLLCLFGTVLANNYNWDPEGTSNDDDSTTDNICLTDTASCGCCLMQKQMYRMEQFFNMSMTELNRGLEKAQAALNKVRSSRSAFSVALTDERRCFGPFREERNVTYKVVFINLGEGYNSTSGVFTVPRSGVYSLALTVYSDSGSDTTSLEACATLKVNGLVLAAPSDRNRQDQEDSTSIALAIQLNAGDQVVVSLPVDCYLCDDRSHYNTFTGFLLYATD